MPVCPLCEHVQGSGDACDVCGRAFANAGGSSPSPSAPRSSGETRDEPSPVARARRWFRVRAQSEDARELPRLQEPARPRLPRIRRSGIRVWWSARRARVTAAEFLRHRLVGYLSGLPLTPDRLPVAFAIDETGVVTSRRGTLPPPEWLTAYVRANGAPALQLDVRLAQADVARASGELQLSQQRLEVARRNVAEAAGAPSIASAAAAGVDASGRPPVPPPWSAAIATLALALLVGQCWQIASPLLGAGGIHAGNLAHELSRQPAAVVLPLLFALGASVGLFVFADFGVRRGRALVDAAPPQHRARWNAGAVGTALAAAGALAWSLVGQRAAGRGGLASVLVTLSVSVALSSLLAVGRRLHAARAEALRAARSWDHAHHLAVARWNRHAAAVETEERECARSAARRAAAIRRLYALRQRLLDVERLASDAAEAERLELQRLCHAIASALELDRHAFLRHAPSGGGGGAERLSGKAEHPLGLAG